MTADWNSEENLAPPNTIIMSTDELIKTKESTPASPPPNATSNGGVVATAEVPKGAPVSNDSTPEPAPAPTISAPAPVVAAPVAAAPVASPPATKVASPVPAVTSTNSVAPDASKVVATVAPTVTVPSSAPAPVASPASNASPTPAVAPAATAKEVADPGDEDDDLNNGNDDDLSEGAKEEEDLFTKLEHDEELEDKTLPQPVDPTAAPKLLQPALTKGEIKADDSEEEEKAANQPASPEHKHARVSCC